MGTTNLFPGGDTCILSADDIAVAIYARLHTIQMFLDKSFRGVLEVHQNKINYMGVTLMKNWYIE